MIFVCIMEYAGKEVIAQVRPSHRAYMHDLIAQGKVIAAGSFAPEGDGGLFLYEAPNREAADLMVAEDPYVKGGAILKYRLREYEIHGANASLLRVTGQ
jgi:uncharacterized protein YciI